MKLTLHLPDILFDHLAKLPTFPAYHLKTEPIMVLPKELIAEADVLYKLNDYYNSLENEEADCYAKAAGKRLDAIERLARKTCREKGLELNKEGQLKEPLKEES